MAQGSALKPNGPPPGVLKISPERMRLALEPLLLRYRVDAVFVGHNHNYERTHAGALQNEPGCVSFLSPSVPGSV